MAHLIMNPTIDANGMLMSTTLSSSESALLHDKYSDDSSLPFDSVASAVHLAHAAAPQRSDDFIRTQARANS